MASITRTSARGGLGGEWPWGKLILIVALFLAIGLYQQITQPAVGGLLVQRSTPSSSSGTRGAASSQELLVDRLNPLGIPLGQAQNLPSIPVKDKELDTKRTIYGGSGDKKHLGGFTTFDVQGVSPWTWKLMIQKYGVHSVLDVGCGRGTSTTWFLYHGVDILCVEGSHDAVQNTLLPDPATQVVEHDFSRGPWWPAKTYDAVWCVEFLEHVGVQYHFNYITAFRKAALIFVTHSFWGGWHHVEVHESAWWIRKFESYGFRYDEELTREVRMTATDEHSKKILTPFGQEYNPQHLYTAMLVFVNPAVAALPQHAHLFPEHGCFGGFKDTEVNGQKKGVRIQKECGTGEKGELETPLNKSMHALELTPEMDTKWEELLRQRIKLPPSS